MLAELSQHLLADLACGLCVTASIPAREQLSWPINRCVPCEVAVRQPPDEWRYMNIATILVLSVLCIIVTAACKRRVLRNDVERQPCAQCAVPLYRELGSFDPG